MGLPRKPKAFDGGEMEHYFREGKIKEVAGYCETDVVGTYQLWLRYELFRGTPSQDGFEASQRNLADFMQLGAELARLRVDQRGHLMGFLYVDGHVRAYHGQRAISSKAYVARRHPPAPTTGSTTVLAIRCW